MINEYSIISKLYYFAIYNHSNLILKLNCEGLITGNNENRVIKMHEAIVYPNPGNEAIKVRIAAQYKQSVFELFDINGRSVLKQNFTGTHGTVVTTFLFILIKKYPTY